MDLAILAAEQVTNYGTCSLALYFNPILNSGLRHPYHLDESILIVLGIPLECFTCTVFCIEIPKTNSVHSDQMPHFEASELSLHHLAMPQKWVSCLKTVNQSET